jgi:siroheme synthase
VMMGLGRIEAIAALLLERGWAQSTPAAVLFGASTPESEVWTYTLGELARGLDPLEQDAPGTVVIGDVVKVRQALTVSVVDDERQVVNCEW